MSKYIIKNCPNCNHTYWDNGYGEVEKSYVCSAEIEWFECKDCPDCLLKQVMEKCKENLNSLETYVDVRSLECAILQNILQLLQIEEVE